jgi:hypothetical protein
MRVMSMWATSVETKSSERSGNDVSDYMRVRADEADDPEESIGAPVGLQMVCMRLEEEKVIKLTEVVVNALKAL